MNHNRLGQTEIKISAMGLGANYVGGHNLYANVDEGEGIRLVKRALELGITHIDTADAYGHGRSEELLGTAIAGSRENVLLATKGGNQFGEFGSGPNNSPEYLRGALERSLKRLGVDYIDLYYIHKYDGETPPEESFGALMEFKSEGLIRAAGLSNFGLEQLQRASTVGRIDAVQACYNLLQREAEADTILWCGQNGVSFIPWGGLAYGLLGGRYQRDMQLDEQDWRQRTGMFSGDRFEQNMDVVDELKGIADTVGAPTAHLAVQWLLSRSSVSSVIAGAKTVEQVEDNVAAENLTLNTQCLDTIDQLTKL